MDIFPQHSIVCRKTYLDQALKFLNKNVIKVLIGQRRVGKSYMLFQIIQHLQTNQSDANIIYINKELLEFEFIKNYEDLYKYVKSKIISNKLNYIFVDEIQEITDFEKALRSLLAEDICDIWCTGNNAHMLSTDIAGLLSGRFVEITINSLNYNEFLEIHKKENTNESFLLFIKYGGLPHLSRLSLEEDIVFDYLKSVYATILYKDIVKRHRIRNVDFLEKLVIFLAQHTGSLYTANKISQFLKSQNIKLSVNQILDLLLILQDSCFINKVQRKDVVGKQIFEINDKYYFEDIGLRNAIVGFRQNDIGKILENIIFLHLKSCGFKIFVGKLADKEIDFVAERNNETIYVQVAYLLTDETTRDREFGNLLEIKDNYPKYVVSMDEIEGNSYKGIIHHNIRKFVSMKF